MTTRPFAASLLAALLWGLAACSAAAPRPSTEPAGPASDRASAAAQPSAPNPSPSSSPRPTRGTLDLDIRSIDPVWTSPLLEFASDGDGVIFASGVADGPDADAAPDLWRYDPDTERPEILWRNPRRDRSLVRIGGDVGLWAFVEMPLDGSRAWDLWLLTEPGGRPIHLDTHPGEPNVSSLVPSFDVSEGQIAWTAFDRGPDGPVSQLMIAHAPHWQPQLLLERRAEEAELWLPSLWGPHVAYSEIRYSDDRSTDDRHVYLLDFADPTAQPMRIDTSGRATMPMLVNNDLVWKETDPGFSMFNWGRLMRYDVFTGQRVPVSMRPQEYVNYPSAGLRFVAAWGADAFTFAIHDLERGESEIVESYDRETSQNVLRPHVAGELLVWMYTTAGTSDGNEVTELRYAWLPAAGTGRDR